MYKPIVLVVLDGWGLGKSDKGNAIAQAKLPTIEKLNKFYPHIALQASGISVGLPWGESGNSEVGHITLGAGKIIYQNMPRITMSIQTGEFFKNREFLKAIDHAQKNASNLHLIGLIGKGGVHSYMDHLYALLELLHNQKMQKVFLHLFTDGRDSSPTSGAEIIQDIQQRLKRYGIGKIATLCGRYFAMDRNNNWNRTEKAYKLLTMGEGKKITDPLAYLRQSYAKENFDEYLEPAIVIENGQPVTTINDNDSLIFFNFREDRARQITKAFVLPSFSKFKRKTLKNIYFVAMIRYEENLPINIAFPPEVVCESLGTIISQNGLSQLRISETEKFAHVTYFFSGGIEEALPGENRIIVPSKSAESFDKIPEMSAEEITNRVLEEIKKDRYAFILINYANADIIGHTGNKKATIKAVEYVDKCLDRLIKAVLLKKGCLFITADHGNAEELLNSSTGEKDTEHSINPVPLWFITGENHRDNQRKESANKQEATGLLSDIAPTILELLKLKKAPEMTGESLLEVLK
jgi:2,3-bisphosphoglycerate-independent phosphoglycerate mutase